MNYGRDHTGFNVLDWAKKGIDLGAGEILLTSVDKEGTRKGFDVDLIKSVSNKINTPIIVSGGMGKLEDIEEISNIGNIHGISMANILHNGRSSVNEIKKFSKKVGFTVRKSIKNVYFSKKLYSFLDKNLINLFLLFFVFLIAMMLEIIGVAAIIPFILIIIKSDFIVDYNLCLIFNFTISSKLIFYILFKFTPVKFNCGRNVSFS